MELKKLSIITICKNNLNGLVKTVESVLCQYNTVDSIEYIIIDGGSTDGTVEYLNQLQIKYNIKYCSESDNGIYSAFNKGIRISTGLWIGIVNSGDILKKGAIQKVLDYIDHNPDYEIFCGWIEITTKGKFKRLMGYSYTLLPELMVPHMGCYIKKEVFNKHGLYNEKFKIAGDYELLLRLYVKGLKFIDMPIIVGEFEDDGISSKLTDTLNTENLLLKKNLGVISFHSIPRSKQILIECKSFLKNIVKILR